MITWVLLQIKSAVFLFGRVLLAVHVAQHRVIEPCNVVQTQLPPKLVRELEGVKRRARMADICEAVRTLTLVVKHLSKVRECGYDSFKARFIALFYVHCHDRHMLFYLNPVPWSHEKGSTCVLWIKSRPKSLKQKYREWVWKHHTVMVSYGDANS